MATVSKEQLKQLFSRIDNRLSRHINVYIIGGASAILGYNVIKETNEYDLAISKIDRGIEKDYEDIARVHKQSPYDRKQLIQIFNTEYIHTVAIGDPRVKKMNLVDLAAQLFGVEVADDTAARIGL